MDFPLLLLALLVLPFAAAAVIVGVSFARRGRATTGSERAGEAIHRMQSDTAAVQDARVNPVAAARPLTSGRVRRAASGAAPTQS